MGKRTEQLSTEQQEFIREQKIFFVGTAMAEGRVNVSPKGMDTLRVLGPNRIMWLNLTGSGNETAAHLQHTDRMTIMFCAFDGKPLILRTYGHASVYHENDTEFQELIGEFPMIKGARQIIDLNIDLVQASCGFAVPLMEYQGDRVILEKWADQKGEEKIRDYWKEKNHTSLDGLPTAFAEEAN